MIIVNWAVIIKFLIIIIFEFGWMRCKEWIFRIFKRIEISIKCPCFFCYSETTIRTAYVACLSHLNVFINSFILYAYVSLVFFSLLLFLWLSSISISWYILLILTCYLLIYYLSFQILMIFKNFLYSFLTILNVY